MNNRLVQLKVKERLNMLDSQDDDNIECWQIAEAFNKVQIEFVRRQSQGYNLKKQGDESSKMAIDDLQPILLEVPLTAVKRDGYYETELIPANYFYFKRVRCKSVMECCDLRNLNVYLAEVANVEDMIKDEFQKPSPEWGETFTVLMGNRLRIYTNNEFDISDINLIYYRRPTDIAILGCVDLNTGNVVTINVDCEFKDDIAEILVDETVAILSGDVESFNQLSRTKQNSQSNS
jgi:hypothetical protein